jgi:hypothetical protein
MPEMQLNDNDEFNIINYLDTISQAISLKEGWEVKTNDII